MTTLEIILAALTIVGFFVTVIGALTGFAQIKDWLARQNSNRLWRKQAKSVSADFYYKRLEIGSRIGANGTQWETLRIATISSFKDNLDEIHLGIFPRDKIAELSMTIAPNSLTLVSFPPSITASNRVAIKTGSKLQKGHVLAFQFAVKFAKVFSAGPKDDFLSWHANRRVDELLLRVIFLDDCGPKVYYKVMDASSRVLHDEELKMDLISKEFRILVKSPLPNLLYSLVWVYP